MKECLEYLVICLVGLVGLITSLSGWLVNYGVGPLNEMCLCILSLGVFMVWGTLWVMKVWRLVRG